MARVVIVLVDGTPGDIAVSVSSDPPADPEAGYVTPAHDLAAAVLDVIAARVSGGRYEIDLEDQPE